jgi:hypothetical protein
LNVISPVPNPLLIIIITDLKSRLKLKGKLGSLGTG